MTQWIRALYQPNPPQTIAVLEKALQKLQTSDEGWQLATSLMPSPDSNIKFFAALTLIVKLNRDRFVTPPLANHIYLHTHTAKRKTVRGRRQGTARGHHRMAPPVPQRRHPQLRPQKDMHRPRHPLYLLLPVLAQVCTPAPLLLGPRPQRPFRGSRRVAGHRPSRGQPGPKKNLGRHPVCECPRRRGRQDRSKLFKVVRLPVPSEAQDGPLYR
jgi:hypothetical protein